MGSLAARRARVEAQRLVEPLGRRWAHVQAVAHLAEDVCDAIGLPADLLVSAAWLHDVGYATELMVTGFHPLDGARHLRRLGLDERLVGLVAHHSCAVVEARLRGLEDQLEGFLDERGALRDALWYCDLTTGPDGQSVSAPERLAEIQQRYGPSHVVTRFVIEAREDLLSAVSRTEARLAMAAPQPR